MQNASFQNTVIRASAGTGKTFQLSNRYLSLAAAERIPSSILATTFTRKAAGEILERVIFRLAEAAIDEKKRSELAAHLAAEANLDVAPGAEVPARLDNAASHAMLRRLLGDLHRLRISTLDSFFIQVARSFSLELALPPGWQIIDEIDDVRLRLDTVRRLLNDHETADVVRLMHLLAKNEVGRSVTDQILSLAADLLGLFQESSPSAWTSLDRLPKLDASELSAAIDALETLRQTGLPKDKRFASAVEGNIRSARAGDWPAFLGKGLAKPIVAEDDTYYRKPITAEIEDAYRPLIDHARAELINQIAAQNEATYRMLQRFSDQYRKIKTAGRALRFEDVARTLLASGLLARLDQVIYRLDGDVDHLLLDEFQDTSAVQWRVLRPFARRVTCGERDGRSFFCVGDVKQAIYGWRGGVAEIFDTVENELDGLTAKPLNRSYRSSRPVIETVNRVFSRLDDNHALNKYREAARQWAGRFQAHDTARTALTGFCQLLTAPAAEASPPPDNSRKTPRPSKRDQKLKTLEFAADKILQLHLALPDRSIGVLVRKNETVGRLIYLLRRRDVDASEEGGNPLTDSNAVNLLLSLLALADHPGDTTARFHVATSCLAERVELVDYEDGAAACRLSESLRNELAADGYGAVVRRLAAFLRPASNVRETTRLEQFVELAFAYELRATARVDDFIDFVRRQRVESPTAAKIRVMTVHQSKGLQFDIVVLPELDEDLKGQTPPVVVGRPSPAADIERVCRYVGEDMRRLLPRSFQAMFEGQQRLVVEEALCVLYVAITRAIHGLFMIAAPSSPSEKAPPSTAAGVLRCALVGEAPVEPEAILFAHGDSDWIDRLAEEDKHRAEQTSPKRCEKAGDSGPTTSPVVRLAEAREHGGRGLERQTPSQLEGGFRIELKSRLRLDHGEALDWGTAMHALFQTVTWLDQHIPTESELREAVRAVVRPGAECDRLLAAFRRAIDLPPVRVALSRATYHQASDPHDRTPVHHSDGLGKPRWEVEAERPFVIVRDSHLLRGTIDRLTLLFDGDRVVGADVLDYKTDAVSPDDPAALADRVETYRPQLAAYSSAVAQIYGLTPSQVSARLLFVSTGVLRRV